MAKPKKNEELDDPTESDWDAEPQPQEEGRPDPLTPEQAELPAQTPEPVALVRQDEPEPAATVHPGGQVIKRKARSLPILSYVILFVAVALATAAILIAIT